MAAQEFSPDDRRRVNVLSDPVSMCVLHHLAEKPDGVPWSELLTLVLADEDWPRPPRREVRRALRDLRREGFVAAAARAPLRYAQVPDAIREPLLRHQRHIAGQPLDSDEPFEVDGF